MILREFDINDIERLSAGKRKLVEISLQYTEKEDIICGFIAEGYVIYRLKGNRLAGFKKSGADKK